MPASLEFGMVLWVELEFGGGQKQGLDPTQEILADLRALSLRNASTLPRRTPSSRS